MIKKILSTLFGLSIGAGILLVLFVAGSSDLDVIDFKSVVIQGGIGVGLVSLGYVGLKFITPIYFN